jgi:hypothetical protein
VRTVVFVARFLDRVSREVDIDSMLCDMCRGFTKFARVDYVKWKEENRLVNDGVTARVRFNSVKVK